MQCSADVSGLKGTATYTIDLATGMFVDDLSAHPLNGTSGFDGKTPWMRPRRFRCGTQRRRRSHGASSGAAREVLERVFGGRHHFITLSNPTVADVVLQYEAFRQITRDVDDARVFGGIHFRFDQEAGATLGRRVGAYAQRNTLRRRHGHDDGDCR